jgi:hypothetical protein
VARRNDDLDDLLTRLGRRNAGLSIDDVAAAVGDALKSQKRQIIQHVGRMIEVERIKSSTAQGDARVKNLHQRLVQVESELRLLRKGSSR